MTQMVKNLPVSSGGSSSIEVPSTAQNTSADDDPGSPSIAEQIPGYVILPGAYMIEYTGYAIEIAGLPGLAHGEIVTHWAGRATSNLGKTMREYGEDLIAGEDAVYGRGKDLGDMLNPVGFLQWEVEPEAVLDIPSSMEYGAGILDDVTNAMVENLAGLVGP